jgi:mono/diheme cytochrome c family protein
MTLKNLSCLKYVALAVFIAPLVTGCQQQGGGLGGKLPGGILAPGALPAAPSNLVASGQSYTQINLFWRDNSLNETGFRVERAQALIPLPGGGTVPGTYIDITPTPVPANSTGYIDAGAAPFPLSPNTLYNYRISAIGATGVSTATAVVSARTLSAPTAPPVAPSGLVATTIAPTLIRLNWTDNSNGQGGIKIERQTGGGAFAQIAAAYGAGPSYTDFNLSPATAYTYRIRATNIAGDSAYAPSATATTQAAPANTSTYSYISLNILGPNCVVCHTANLALGNVRYDSYTATRATVSAGNANGSRLYTEMISGRMPPGAPLTTLQENQIRDWINAGALNN